MEFIFFIIAVISFIILVMHLRRYGYIYLCCAFNIYSFTLFGGYYWLIPVFIILISIGLCSDGEKLFYYLLILLTILNIFSIIISLFKTDFILIPIFILNLYVLYNFYLEYSLFKLKKYFKHLYGMTYEEAIDQIRVEKFLEWGARALLGNILNVWGFLFKPLTDELGHKIFGSTNIRQGIAFIDTYEDEISKHPRFAFLGYLAIIIIYSWKHIPFSYQMSYTFIVEYIIGIF